MTDFPPRTYSSDNAPSDEGEKAPMRPSNKPSGGVKGWFFGLRSATRIAVAMVGLVALWVLSGLIFRFDGGEVQEASQEIIPTVAVERVLAKPKLRNMLIYGVTEPLRTVELKMETEGRVVEIVAKEGAFLKKGDPILKIDQRERNELMREAQALVDAQTLDYKVAKGLADKGFQSDTAVKRALADLQAARARFKNANINLSYTVLSAPFDGIVETIAVEEGSLVGPNFSAPGQQDQGQNNSQGRGIATFVQKNPFLVVGHVSEHQVKLLSTGMPAEAHLATGGVVEGQIRYIASIADPNTRTFRVEFEVPNPSGVVVGGVTAEVDLPVDIEPAHFIKNSSLALNEAGEIGVKLLEPVDEPILLSGEETEGKVHFYPIEVYESDAEGVWVTGLKKQVFLIGQGQAFVKAGQVVKAKLDEAQVMISTEQKEGQK
jgi:multidrug efflux system membrane fusion protein